MGTRIFGNAGRFEFFGPREPRRGRSTIRFLDRDEALRFLRENLSDPADLDRVRRWSYDQGLRPYRDGGFLDAIATELGNGRMHVAHIAAAAAQSSLSSRPPEPPAPQPPGPGPGPKPATKVARLVVNVKDLNGRPVVGARVEAVGLGAMETDENGVANFDVVTPGTYDITAEKAGHGKVRNGAIEIDTKPAVNVPDGTTTTVNLVQHPECANVAYFQGATARNHYFGFDHKTDMVTPPNIDPVPEKGYWNPVPAKGSLTAPGNRATQDGARWVSVAIGKEAEVEINYDFTGGDCIPCIANTTFEVSPASVAEVVTKKITAKQAAFKIKGLADGEATLKVKCDGKDIGWFHIYCKAEVRLFIDIDCIITSKSQPANYDVGVLSSVFADIYRQALIAIDIFDLGVVDLTGSPMAAQAEVLGYPAGSNRLFSDAVTDSHDTQVFTLLDNAAQLALATRTGVGAAPTAATGSNTVGPKPRANARRLHFYAPLGGAAAGTSNLLGQAIDIGSDAAFTTAPDSPTTRVSSAHEFGHMLGLKHPAHDPTGSQFAHHCWVSKNQPVPAYDATNTEPASEATTAHSNIMALDPTNLMGYWIRWPENKRLRYQQWKSVNRANP